MSGRRVPAGEKPGSVIIPIPRDRRSSSSRSARLPVRTGQDRTPAAKPWPPILPLQPLAILLIGPLALCVLTMIFLAWLMGLGFLMGMTVVADLARGSVRRVFSRRSNMLDCQAVR